ncbi:MAG: hypothetical protein EAZ37_00970 [Burkholderiales bacterium]|nr:MAG: hypothetical protein EAZ37_00970 [Burkholderiales bacterium]
MKAWLTIDLVALYAASMPTIGLFYLYFLLWRAKACARRRRHALMSQSSELRDTRRVIVVRCAAKIGHVACGDHRP